MRTLRALAVLATIATAAAQDHASPGTRFPEWLKAGGEVAVRFDAAGADGFERGKSLLAGVERTRLHLELAPRQWLTVHIEGHDARAVGVHQEQLDGVSNRFDLRQAWAELGNPESGWSLRAGRQELAFGDERLVGADSEWDNLGRVFDATRLTARRGRWTVDAFGALVVPQRHHRMDTPLTGERLYGVYSSFAHGGGVVDPFALFKTLRAGAGLDAQDLRTYGVRAAGKSFLNLEYNVEVAVQNGRSHRVPVQAWSGHWELGHKIGNGEGAPRVAVEYNHASGDDDPADGRRTTFDDLYPAGYNQYGTSDPFAARNLRSAAVSAGWQPAKRWTLNAGIRHFWLANVHDALYTNGEDYRVWKRNATSSAVGAQALVGVSREISANMTLHVGLASFAPGAYLRQSGLSGRYTTPYVTWRCRF